MVVTLYGDRAVRIPIANSALLGLYTHQHASGRFEDVSDCQSLGDVSIPWGRVLLKGEFYPGGRNVNFKTGIQ